MAFDCLFPFIGSKKHRAHSSLIGDPTVPADQVEPLGHRGVCGGDGVIHFIDERRDLKRHLQHAGLSDFDPFVEAPVFANENAIFDILLDLPAVGRVDLLDVDREEVDPLTIGEVDAIEGPSLGPKGRSGITSEYQSDWSFRESIGETNLLAVAVGLTGQDG